MRFGIFPEKPYLAGMKKYYLFIAAVCASLAVIACGGKPGTNPDPDPEPEPEPPVPVECPDFARGADISWVSEMEHDGRTFKKKDGTQANIFEVLKDCGMNAIRLRVWVDPYGGWSGTEDVVALGKRATAAGLALMVDFHYSDFFADPSRQQVPAAWAADKDDLQKMCAHVAEHTTAVLQAFKEAGVAVHWVQVGNETRNGMLWPAGQLWNNSGNIPDGRKHFAQLYNAGYQAVKALYPNALVMPHLNNAYDDNDWWFKEMKAAGLKMDAIALSHYPQAESKFTASQYNQKAVDQINRLYATYGVPVIVSEVGVKPSKSDAASVMAGFMSAVKALEGCAGVFYWEPEVYGGWVPSVYKDADAIYKYTGKRETWRSYDQAAFTASGQPSAILDCFAP